MRETKKVSLSVSLIALFVMADPVAGADIDWEEVKSVWHTLTPEEQEIYRAQMPEEWSQASQRFGGGLPGDTCEMTVPVTLLPFSDSGDNSALADDYDIDTSNTCNTGFNSSGTEIVYSVICDATTDVTVTETFGTYDVVLWAVTDCSDADNTCVGSSDSGNPESITFTATAGTEYFVMVDGWNGQGGIYTLDLTSTAPCICIPVELETFNVSSVD